MAPKKGHLGYDTPATSLQEKYTSVVEAIVGVKANWKDIRNKIEEMWKETTERLEQAKSAGPEGAEDVNFWLTQRSTVLILGLVARLGIESADLHKRVASCEKKIDELKAAL